MKLIKIYNFENIDQIKILVELTDSCNYSCKYCYNEKPRKNYFINVFKLIEFIKNINKKTKRTIKIELIGGEPTLHPQFMYICKELSLLNFINKIEIYTNFHLDIEKYQLLTKNRKIEINATWHSLINDNKNYNFYNKILKINSKTLSQYYFIVMFENDNFNNSVYIYKKIYNYLNKYSVLNIEPVLCIYGDGSLYNYDKNNLKIYYDICANIQKYKKQYILQYENNITQIATIHDIELLKNKSFKNWKCNAGKDFLYIHSNGNIYKCDQDYIKNKPIGNLNSYINYDFKPTICRYDYCPWNYEIYKKIIF